MSVENIKSSGAAVDYAGLTCDRVDCIYNPRNPANDGRRICLAASALTLVGGGSSELNPDSEEQQSYDDVTKRKLAIVGGVMGMDPLAASEMMVGDCLYNGGDTEPVVQVYDIPSDKAPFHVLPEKLPLSPRITGALSDIYREFQDAFDLPDGHRENDTDYRYCLGSGSPMMAVQIDMAGLTAEEMAEIETKSPDEAREFIRGKIFEIEGSIAGYGILGGLFSDAWGKEWQAALDRVREAYQKPILLLAPTEQKYRGMLGFEFGLSEEEIASGVRPTREQIKETTGFDDFYGPDEYREYLDNAPRDENDLPVDHPLLYVRASDPVEKLKNPNVAVEHPLFSDKWTRRVTRAFTLTPNIDDPDSPKSQHINDTKSYMPALGLGVEVSPDKQGFDSWKAGAGDGAGSLKMVGENEDNQTIEEIRTFLESRGIDPESDDYKLRFKPTVDAYGGYGHFSIPFENGHPVNGKKLKKLLKNIDERGSYIMQPELNTRERHDPATGMTHREIFRIFLSTDPRDGEIRPMGAFVNSIPVTSQEIKGSVERVHGNGGAVFREITM